MLIQGYSIMKAHVLSANYNCLSNLIKFSDEIFIPRTRGKMGLEENFCRNDSSQKLSYCAFLFMCVSLCLEVEPLCFLLVSPEIKLLASCSVTSVYQSVKNENWGRGQRNISVPWIEFKLIFMLSSPTLLLSFNIFDITH